ncbi:MAG: DUF5107 domain-containing protein [Reichenbachiella sp.]
MIIAPEFLFGQVVLRDSLVTWQHHRFELNDDFSMKTASNDDSDIEEVTFDGKVIENDLIRLVVLPEYGARVISFFYKPTGHEYLYQSECGSAYGIGEGNFYYDWLMVYGGIFPTLPEPEHGKSWLLPWDYSVIENSSEKVIVRMELTDDTQYNGAPGGFNNGITGITCQVDITVYNDASIWDFDVKLINNRSENINYEYWTCTTMTPGTDPGNTSSPLTSEIVIPVEEYEAGWSPNSWIGGNGSIGQMSEIEILSEWSNMGIAYAKDLKDQFWGVINHENEEGIFRISENVETSGMKLWTWGQDNVDNDMFDYSNGGADNYIELWAGVSDRFFSDAVLTPLEQKAWTESYVPSIGMAVVDEMNEFAGIGISWDNEFQMLKYQLNTFHANASYDLEIYLDDYSMQIENQLIQFSPLGLERTIDLSNLSLISGSHKVIVNLIDDQDNAILMAEINFENNPVLGLDEIEDEFSVRLINHRELSISSQTRENYDFQLINLNGQLLQYGSSDSQNTTLKVSNGGLYIVQVTVQGSAFSKKIWVN